MCSPDMNTAARRLGEFKRLVGAFSLDVDIRNDVTHICFCCKYRPDTPLVLGLTEIVFLVSFVRRATRQDGHRVRDAEGEAPPFRSTGGDPANAHGMRDLDLRRQWTWHRRLRDSHQERCVTDHVEAPQDIRMPTKVLGGGMHHDVTTELKRPLIDGSRKGIVDRGQCAMRMRYVGYRAQIENTQQRIGRRFKPD